MAQNFLTAFKNTKTRTLVLVVGTTLVAGVIFLIFNLKGGKNPALETPSKVVGVPREAQSVPGAQTSEQYRKLLAEENKKRAEEAEKTKKSALPTFNKGGGSGDNDPNNPFGINVGGAAGKSGQNSQFGLNGAGGPNDPFGDTSRGGFVGGGNFSAQDQQRKLEEDRQKRLDEQKKRFADIEEEKRRKSELALHRQELQAAAKQYQQSVQESASQMANYAKGATVSWTSVTTQAYVQGVHANPKKTPNGSGAEPSDQAGTQNANMTGNAANNNTPLSSEKTIIKAGTVLYAVLDTAINSDEQGPVLATIVSGKYKGGRLMGKIQLQSNASKILITFSLMSLPKKTNSVSINAFAIDPETARTAFASDVDNHYLLRYGSLFASSFMEGFGKAVGQAGTTTTDPSGGQTQTKPALSPKEQIYTAFGTVGEKWAKQVEPLFKRPVTVTVDQGLGVGVLFMQDTDLSGNNIPAVTPPAVAPPVPGTTPTTAPPEPAPVTAQGSK